MTQKVGRNDPCPCGSGKKYKNCCMQKEQQTQQRVSTTPLGKRKFTAKVLSGGGAAKPQPQEGQAQQKQPVDYTTLMERSFGNAIHDDEKPPMPASSEQYIVQEKETGSHPT